MILVLLNAMRTRGFGAVVLLRLSRGSELTPTTTSLLVETADPRDFGPGLVSREPRASDLASTKTSFLVEAADPMPVICVAVRLQDKQDEQVSS